MSFHVPLTHNRPNTTEHSASSRHIVSYCVLLPPGAFHGLFFLFFLFTTFCHCSTSGQHSCLSSAGDGIRGKFYPLPICLWVKSQCYPIIPWWIMMNILIGRIYGCSSPKYINIWKNMVVQVVWLLALSEMNGLEFSSTRVFYLHFLGSQKIRAEKQHATLASMVKYTYSLFDMIGSDCLSLFLIVSIHYPFHQKPTYLFTRSKNLHPEEGWRHHKPWKIGTWWYMHTWATHHGLRSNMFINISSKTIWPSGYAGLGFCAGFARPTSKKRGTWPWPLETLNSSIWTIGAAWWDFLFSIVVNSFAYEVPKDKAMYILSNIVSDTF